jgi:riboflavin synthase
MFTGIIEETGSIVELVRSGNSMRIKVKSRSVLEDAKPGDSMAVNGVCVTLTGLERGAFSADISPETIEKTSMRAFREGDVVNLERAVSMASRLGGHFVTGHVDGTGTVDSISNEKSFWKFSIKAQAHLMKHIASKGSVALNGVSLTPYDCTKELFSVMIIPETIERTSLKTTHSGDLVNIECDILSKYVEQLLILNAVPGFQDESSKKIDADFLRRTGFLI